MRKTNLVIISILLVVATSGCASLVAKTPKTVLLQDEQIYTIPAGQEIAVELNHKPMALTFPYPMKLMSIDRAIRDEQMKNEAALKDVKAQGEKKTLWTIIVTILGIIGSIFGMMFFKRIKWPTISAKVETK